MQELTCIVCPNGCTLRVEEQPKGGYAVSGQRCKRGDAFALEELTAPKRVICSTVRTVWPHIPVVPVRLSAPIPKEQIFPVMAEINKVLVTLPTGRGHAVIQNVLGLGVDVIVTSNILREITDGGNAL